MVEPAKNNFAIGIDVGGTNTDGVLVEFSTKRIISEIKATTTKDIQTGVANAI